MDVLRKELHQDLGDSLQSLVLYGSFARGDFRAGSDLDLIIVLKSADPRPFRRIDLVLPAVIRARNSSAFRRLRRQGFMPDFAPLVLRIDELKDTPSVLIDAAYDGVIVYDTGVIARKFLSIKRRLRELKARRVWTGPRGWYWLLSPDLKPAGNLRI
jgi:predicted nucleotidyltransferase